MNTIIVASISKLKLSLAVGFECLYSSKFSQCSLIRQSVEVSMGRNVLTTMLNITTAFL